MVALLVADQKFKLVIFVSAAQEIDAAIRDPKPGSKYASCDLGRDLMSVALVIFSITMLRIVLFSLPARFKQRVVSMSVST